MATTICHGQKEPTFVDFSKIDRKSNKFSLNRQRFFCNFAPQSLTEYSLAILRQPFAFRTKLHRSDWGAR